MLQQFATKVRFGPSHARRRRWGAFFGAAAFVWTGLACAEADLRTVLGEWVGTYVCAQGLTGLTLTVVEATPSRAQALFHFYADPRNPRVPTGCFTMDGSYDPASGRLQLRGRDWLLRPAGYRVVSFDGQVDAQGQRFQGEVVLSGCKRFDLSRQASPATPPPKCVPPTAPVAQADQASAGSIAEALSGQGRIDLNILFDFAKASIRPDGVSQLDELGRILAAPQFAGRRIALYGHTDAVGSDESNRALSQHRAAAARDYLVERFRLPAARFEVRGFGKARLKRPDAPLDESNRRVEVLLLPVRTEP